VLRIVETASFASTGGAKAARRATATIRATKRT
jgi:hypothetical protein